MKVEESGAKAIKIDLCGKCTKYSSVIAYVSQFSSGGFWHNDERLVFVTAGYGSDKDATYEDARGFIVNWRKNKLQKNN